MIERGPGSRRHRVASPPRVGFEGSRSFRALSPRTQPRSTSRPISADSDSRSRSWPRPWTPSRTPTSRSASAGSEGSPSSTSRGCTPATRTRRRSSSGLLPPSPAGRRPCPCGGLRAAGPGRADPRGHHPNQGARSERGGRDDAGIGMAPCRACRRCRSGPLPRPVPGQQRSPHLDLDPGPLARRPHRRPAAPGPRRQHRERRGRLSAHAPGGGRDLRRGRAGRGCTTREVLGIGVPQVSATLEVAAARDRFDARDRPVRPGRHRWRHEDRWGHCQGHRLRRRRGDARIAVRRRARGARARLQLGHGRSLADASARHADPDRRAPALEQILFGPAETTHGTQNLWAPCASRWRRSAHARSTRCTTSRWSSRRDRHRGQVLAARRPRVAHLARGT